MSKFIDLTGNKYNRLTVSKRDENNKNNEAMWRCKCECGNTRIVSSRNLKSGRVKSCGCLKEEASHKTNYKTLRYDNIRMYNIWRNVKNRCLNSNDFQYLNYGGRGIKVCDEWIKHFSNFYNWAINNGYKEYLTIDRIDVNGNYEPDNCRWATSKQQARNRRSNHSISYKNETKTLIEWSEILNISKSTLCERLRSGWNIEKAFSTTSEEGKKHNCKKVICITTDKMFNSVKEAAKFYEIDSSGLAKCCNGKYKTYGKLKNGAKLEWKYI
jgi:hypothetical protein